MNAQTIPQLAQELITWNEAAPMPPILAFHSPVDEEAPYEDALVSVDRLRRRGATIAVRTLPGFDHVKSGIQALPRTVRWFRALH